MNYKKHPPVKEGEKYCTKCKTIKLTSDFSRYIGHWDNLAHDCRECQKEAKRIYRDNNPDLARDDNLKRRHNLTQDDYCRILNIQNSKCAICKSENPGKTGHSENRRNRVSDHRFHVDHDHISGKIRGLLCVNCNRGLGYFKDNISNLKECIEYLIRSSHV